MQQAGFEGGDVPMFFFSAPPSPERNLLAAVLGKAFLDLSDDKPEYIRQEALQYIEGRVDSDDGFSSSFICEQLELCVEEIRRIAVRYYRNPTLMKPIREKGPRRE